jgi:hypothetical protein
MKMLRKLILLIVLSGCTLVARSQSVQPMDANDCALILFKALQDKDSGTLQTIMSPDFSVTNFDGQPFERNFLIRALEEGVLKIESGMLSGMRTRNYGDVGLVQGNWSARGQIQNISFNNDLAYMLVAVKAGGSWKVTALQFTPLR